jgi:cell division protein FtsL
MARQLRFIPFVIATFMLICCTSPTHQSLEAISYCLKEDSLAEAEAYMDLININELNEEEKAIYYLQEAIITYKKYLHPKSFDGINYSIDYFSKKRDERNLAEAYFYKAALENEAGLTEKAINNLKCAEFEAQSIQDVALHHKIDELQCSVFGLSGLYEVSIKYARRNLEQAIQEKNKNWYVYALDALASAYYLMGKKDSALYYINKILPYEKYLEKETMAEVYTNIGVILSYQDIELAKKYLHKAITFKNYPNAYASLAFIEIGENNNRQAAKEHLDSALTYSTGKDAIYIVRKLTTLHMEDKEYEKACRVLLKKDSLTSIQNDIKQDLSRIQLRYDILYKEKRQSDLIHMALIIAILVVACIAFLIFHHQYRYLKVRKELMQRQMLIEKYNNKFKDLQLSEKEELRENFISLQEKQAKAIYKGKQLYDHINEGGSVVNWSKQDYLIFIDYFNLVDASFSIRLETEYNNLSPRYKVYLILQNMGKSDEDIEYIFGIGKSAIRSIKSRIKLKNEENMGNKD